MNLSAVRLFAAIGEISDDILEEVETADIAGEAAKEATGRKRIVKYSTLAAGLSLGVAVTLLVIRSKRKASRVMVGV